jgi:hypothetical protein
MVSGAVLIDLRDVAPDRSYRRTTGLSVTPSGARVVVDPRTVRLLAEHTDRLDIEVWGEPFTVTRWLEALREPGLLSGVA